MHQITVTDSQSKYLINIKKVYLNTFYQLLLMWKSFNFKLSDIRSGQVWIETKVNKDFSVSSDNKVNKHGVGEWDKH